MERKYIPREDLIAEAIRKNKEERSKKYTRSTSFKPGQKPPPGSGRKKGVKNDAKKKAARQWKKHWEELMVELILSARTEDLSTLSLKDKFQIILSGAKFWIPEMKSVDVKETQVRKIEVSYTDDFTHTVDIKHEDIPLIENSEEAGESE